MIVSNFGTMSPTLGKDCPAKGSWETWCDCMWPADKNPTLNSKCRAPLPGAPWTIGGAALRSIPHASGVSIPGLTPPLEKEKEEQKGEDAAAEEGIFGIPTTIMYVGGGVLLAGIAAFIMLKPKPKAKAMSGYKRKGRKVRRKKARR